MRKKGASTFCYPGRVFDSLHKLLPKKSSVHNPAKCAKTFRVPENCQTYPPSFVLVLKCVKYGAVRLCDINCDTQRLSSPIILTLKYFRNRSVSP